MVAPPPPPGAGNSCHQSEEGSTDEGVCKNEGTFPWPIPNWKGDCIFLDATFQIDNWAPINFLSDVHMPTEELVFNSFHFKVVWF